VTPMTDQEREYYDAQASVEAWDFALSVLNPWTEAAHAIGLEELLEAMQAACERASFERALAFDRLAELGGEA